MSRQFDFFKPNNALANEYIFNTFIVYYLPLTLFDQDNIFFEKCELYVKFVAGTLKCNPLISLIKEDSKDLVLEWVFLLPTSSKPVLAL